MAKKHPMYERSEKTTLAIVSGMARQIWKNTFVAYAPDEVPPATPSAATRAALDLSLLYETMNPLNTGARVQTHASAVEMLYTRALESRMDFTPDSFGEYLVELVMHASRLNPKFDVMIPVFTATLDGEQLVWDGRVDDSNAKSGVVRARRYLQRRNPKKPHKVQHTKTVAETRRLIAKMDHCSKGCQGWDIFDTNRGFEIQVCDECNSSLSEAQQLADVDVAQLPEAKKALAEANETYAENPGGTKRFLVLMVNGDPKDTHAVELEGLTEEDFHEAIVEALDIANPDERDSIMYTSIDSTDAGAARVDPRLQRQQWKLYKGAGPITTNPCGGRGGKR